METMTVKEVLELTMRNLGNIQIPVALMQQIGIPISGAIQNIGECIKAMDEAAKNAPEVTIEEAEDERAVDAE